MNCKHYFSAYVANITTQLQLFLTITFININSTSCIVLVHLCSMNLIELLMEIFRENTILDLKYQEL